MNFVFYIPRIWRETKKKKMSVMHTIKLSKLKHYGNEHCDTNNKVEFVK